MPLHREESEKDAKAKPARSYFAQKVDIHVPS